MEAVAWTAIALLGAAVLGSFGAVFYLGSYLGSRIDAQGTRLDARIDTQTVRIDRLVEEVSAVTSAVHALTTRVDAHLERHAG